MIGQRVVGSVGGRAGWRGCRVAVAVDTNFVDKLVGRLAAAAAEEEEDNSVEEDSN